MSIVAAKSFSLPELARLIEELQWSWSANRTVKGRGRRRRSAPRLRQGGREDGGMNPARPEAIQAPLFPKSRSPLGALQQFTPTLAPLDLPMAGGLSKKRLLALLPWGSLGLALAAVDSNIAGALVLGGAYRPPLGRKFLITCDRVNIFSRNLDSVTKSWIDTF